MCEQEFSLHHDSRSIFKVPMIINMMTFIFSHTKIHQKLSWCQKTQVSKLLQCFVTQAWNIQQMLTETDVKQTTHFVRKNEQLRFITCQKFKMCAKVLFGQQYYIFFRCMFSSSYFIKVNCFYLACFSTYDFTKRKIQQLNIRKLIYCNQTSL